jgi:hypothetical protein
MPICGSDGHGEVMAFNLGLRWLKRRQILLLCAQKLVSSGRLRMLRRRSSLLVHRHRLLLPNWTRELFRPRKLD